MGLVTQFHKDGCAGPLLCVVVQDREGGPLVVSEHRDVDRLGGVAVLL